MLSEKIFWILSMILLNLNLNFSRKILKNYYKYFLKWFMTRILMILTLKKLPQKPWCVFWREFPASPKATPLPWKKWLKWFSTEWFKLMTPSMKNGPTPKKDLQMKEKMAKLTLTKFLSESNVLTVWSVVLVKRWCYQFWANWSKLWSQTPTGDTKTPLLWPYPK